MYPDAIVRGIKAARAMVLVFSGYSNVSPHVLRELERAVSLNKIVIPLRLEHATLSNNMEYLISSCHWFDAVETPLDESVRGLVKKLERLLLD
jgi:hypothetical protein